MSRRKLIAGNWKMNLSMAEAITLASDIARQPSESVDIAVIPPFPWIVPVQEALGESEILIGAQNCHWEDSGAFTGEVSARMLSDLCDFTLAGHSERRHIFNESDEQVGLKVSAIARTGMQSVLCVGETIGERRAGDAKTVVARQLGTGLGDIGYGAITSVTIAYEPVWAIGTGAAATSEDAQEMCAFIRSWLAQRFGDAGASVRVLYGGSMNPANAAELLGRPDVDGGLVGGASLNAETFLEIVAAAETIRSL